jgi:hypothetical protein
MCPSFKTNRADKRPNDKQNRHLDRRFLRDAEFDLDRLDEDVQDEHVDLLDAVAGLPWEDPPMQY